MIAAVERFICIHGHFYQPPRENPWLEAVELQDSAYPYHDWNERITTECYAANAAARILDGKGYIERIANNYARISFNVGPTLLAWLEEHAHDAYEAIVVADRESVGRFSGHGSALAQAYNHLIMPLASRRDKVTQVRWGVADFRRRFGREPEGMWLPETAVDLETLEVLAEHGLRFTILAPHQASRVRRLGERAWREVPGGSVDPTTPYTVNLPSGRSIAVFFYDGPVSRAVAFERLLTRGEDLAHRLAGTFNDSRPWPQLAHIATDGETYGHHHRFGEMALAYALQLIETEKLARLTNYGEFLELHPPTDEAQVVPGTSWSCSHGIERWRADCGCDGGSHPSWNQAWRGPLREAFDWLRDALTAHFHGRGRELLRDPDGARDDYIAVVLDRSPERVSEFLARHAAHQLGEDERVAALKLLEMQRHLMLMYTSCGWFFDDVSGIETVQVIEYAGRAVQLAGELFGDGADSRFLSLLERAASNLPDHRNGRAIYERCVRPAMVDLQKVGAHVAISSLFDSFGERSRVYCYEVRGADRRLLETGRLRLAVGRFDVASRITRERADLAYAVLHFGDHNLSCGVGLYDETGYRALLRESRDAFAHADVPEVIRLLDRHFSGPTHSLKSLFRDEQRRIVGIILASTLAEAESEYSQLVDQHAPLMHFLAGLGVPLPRAFLTAAELVLNARLRAAFAEDPLDLERIKALLAQAQEVGAALDGPGLAFALRSSLERLAGTFEARPEDAELLQRLVGATGLAVTLPFEVDLWQLQNRAYRMVERILGESARRGTLSEADRITAERLGVLAELLHLRPGT